MMRRLALPVSLIAFTATAPAFAQQPGAITSGATDVTIDGKPAARVGDTTSDGKMVEGSTNVFGGRRKDRLRR
jgi:uncharacterized Zn-binding protein involved in type VI secretion